MESSFAGMDMGKDKGNHLTAEMLESMGRDLCRTILIYTQIYVPPELSNLFKVKPKPKVYKEDEIQSSEVEDDCEPVDFTKMIMEELSENKTLMKIGEGNST